MHTVYVLYNAVLYCAALYCTVQLSAAQTSGAMKTEGSIPQEVQSCSESTCEQW
jgi:hypothetical protein